MVGARPLVEAVGQDEAPPCPHGAAEHPLRGGRLRPGVDGAGPAVVGPGRHQPPAQGAGPAGAVRCGDDGHRCLAGGYVEPRAEVGAGVARVEEEPLDQVGGLGCRGVATAHASDASLRRARHPLRLASVGAGVSQRNRNGIPRVTQHATPNGPSVSREPRGRPGTLSKKLRMGKTKMSPQVLSERLKVAHDSAPATLDALIEHLGGRPAPGAWLTERLLDVLALDDDVGVTLSRRYEVSLLDLDQCVREPERHLPGRSRGGPAGGRRAMPGCGRRPAPDVTGAGVDNASTRGSTPDGG